MSRMRIAMIGAKGVSSRGGGVEVHVRELGRRLVRMGHDVSVYTRPHYSHKRIKGYEGMNLRSIPTVNTKHLDAIVHTLLSAIDSLMKDFDILHFHAIGPSSLCFIPKLAGKRVVCTIHGLDWKREKWGRFARSCLKLGERAAVTIPDKTIAVSKAIQQYVTDTYEKDCRYIPNGVSLAQKAEARLITEKYFIKRNDFFLYLGRLVPEKGVHYLIQAYNKLETRRKLVIAGSISHSEEYGNYLKNIAGKNNSILFAGHVEGRELQELFTNAYAYILPSEVEGLSIALLEAMSYGQCVIASNIVENTEVIGDKGWTFRNKDIESLYGMLAFADSNPEKVAMQKQKAEEYILGRYSWDKVSLETLEIYKSILQKSK